MKIWCTGIVHYPDGVILVRESVKDKWRLPERELTDIEDILLCMRRCVLLQTGHRTAKLRFYKIQTQAKTNKKSAFIRFIFGCEVGTQPIQLPEQEAKFFTPNEIIKLAVKHDFDDPILLNLLHRYEAMAKAPEEPVPFPTIFF